MEDDHAMTKPWNDPYIFKNYLPDGSAEYQVRQGPKLISSHDNAQDASDALEKLS